MRKFHLNHPNTLGKVYRQIAVRLLLTVDSDASILRPVKHRFFIFFSLYTTQIIVHKLFSIFICPSSTQQPKIYS